jgi:hypothetical protein
MQRIANEGSRVNQIDTWDKDSKEWQFLTPLSREVSSCVLQKVGNDEH